MREGVIRFCIVKREYDTMDNETKENLTELRHQQELLRTDVEGNMRTMKAENNEALAKNEAAIERPRTDIEKNINTHTTKIMIFIGVVIGVVTLILRFL